MTSIRPAEARVVTVASRGDVVVVVASDIETVPDVSLLEGNENVSIDWLSQHRSVHLRRGKPSE